MQAKNEAPFWKGALGCLAGLFLHLVIGSLYQWGIINIYVTSYYKIFDPTVTLENNAVVFPLMMMCIGLTMKPGIMLAERIGAFWTLLLLEVFLAGVMLASSFLPNFPVVYGIVFGLLAGMTFMLPLIQCNKYFPGKRMYVNGFILVGTGLGSAIFGQFSNNFLNPERIPSNLGYYDGELAYIALKTPECIRYLSLFYICLGLAACALIRPVIVYNANKAALVSNANDTGDASILNLVPPTATVKATASPVQPTPPSNDCPNLTTAFKSWICWILCFVAICSTCGVLLINGNYKTYVKKQINNDNYLTLIGAIGSIGNGCTRFFWSLLFSKIGYRPVMSVILLLVITVLVVIRYTVSIQQLYCFMVFLTNACLGAVLVVTPTMSMQVFGAKVGSEIYSFYWCSFATANLLSYVYVSQLTGLIGFNNVLYICAGMAAAVLVVLALYDFRHQWKIEGEVPVVVETQGNAGQPAKVEIQQDRVKDQVEEGKGEGLGALNEAQAPVLTT